MRARSVLMLAMTVLASCSTINESKADVWTADCECNFASDAYSCHGTWPISGESFNDLHGICGEKTRNKGYLIPPGGTKIVEQTVSTVCSGQSGPYTNDKKGQKVAKEGLRPWRVCAPKGPPGKVASKLHCEMYDDATGQIPCTWSDQTNGSCPYMASRSMVIANDPSGNTYCWLFNNEDVGRSRTFFLSAEYD